MVLRNQPTALCFYLFAMIQSCTYLYSSMYSPQWGKQGINQQILNTKLISYKITHPKS